MPLLMMVEEVVRRLITVITTVIHMVQIIQTNMMVTCIIYGIIGQVVLKQTQVIQDIMYILYNLDLIGRTSMVLHQQVTQHTIHTTTGDTTTTPITADQQVLPLLLLKDMLDMVDTTTSVLTMHTHIT
jgi:hypothetical protein